MDDLRPRDIQTRVRAGEDPQALAEEAGTPLDRVMRFAYPVLQERVRVVDEARRARTRSSQDNQTAEFGALFDHRIGVLGTEPSTVRWDSFRRPDGGWTVTAAFTADVQSIEPQELIAKFSFALANRMVSALNDVAADLLNGNPIAALQKSGAAKLDFDELDAITVGTPTTARLSAVPDPDPAENTSPDRGALRLPLRRQKAHTHPLPVSVDDEIADELFDQEALEPAGETWSGGDLEPAPVDDPSIEPGSSDEEQPLGQHADLADQAESDVEDTPHSHRRANRSSDKPRMPSWDDILLGVRRRSD